MAARGEVERFYDEELSTRDALGFPPFSRLLRLVFRGRDVEQVKRTATEFAEEAERHLSDNAEVMGPAECPLAKIARNHRHQVILRSRAFGETHRALRSLLSSMRAFSGVYWEIDVDPVSLL
jgi:primosomal protein N' (replication factor Y)